MKSKPFLLKAFAFVVLHLTSGYYCAFAQNLVINEVMFLNDSALADQDGEFYPWVELYNRGDETVQLGQFYLSNDILQPKQWKIPAIELPADSFMTVFLSGKNITVAPPFHAGFTVENLIHRVYLFRSGGSQVDVTPEQCIPQNRSAGRLPDGFSSWEMLSHSSPQHSNNLAWADSWPQPDQSLQVSHNSGYYESPFSLELSTESNSAIHYTLNTGATPTHLSPVYMAPLPLINRHFVPNEWANIQTTELPSSFYFPEVPVNKANVVRAVAYESGCPVSKVYTGNFLIDPTGYKYPADVVFLNTNSENLFDDQKGIYVFGEDENYKKRGELWERPAHVTFINSDGQVYLKQDAGIRIHGGGTREGPQKSLRLYARDKYGKEVFEYPFFQERPFTEYKRLLLRMSMGDWSRTLFKDHLCHHLVRNIDVDYQAGKVAIVFINGEYWGVHNIRERQDKHYLEQLHNIDDDNLDIVEYNIINGGPIAEEGTMDFYEGLLYFLQENDLSQNETYQEISEMVDIDNFIDQHVSQLYFANTDFPENNNSFWRERSTDGIWRWMFYDCDACMIRSQHNHLFDNLGEGEIHNLRPAWSMVLFRSLLRNEEFRNRFVSRFRTLLNTTFSAGTVIDAINEFEKMYAPLVPEHIERWHYPHNFHEWQENVQSMRIFAIDRPIMLNQWLDRYFGQPFILHPNPSDGQFNIQFYGKVEVGVVEIYSSTGAKLIAYNFDDSFHESLSFSESLLPGIYLVRVEVSGTYYTQKLVVSGD